MFAVLKFTFFNVILGLVDILTDLSTFFFLLEEDHFLWALLTAQWMLTPFLIHAFDFIIRVSEAKWKTGSTGYDTFGALALGFYNEAATHLPFVMAVHNLWRAKLLYNLNYGHPSFRSRDSKKVQEILYKAGKGSFVESMYEAGPQSVTQVYIVLSTGNLNGTQIFSLITSVMSLSWGASRSFLILRPADKADPDPELMTVSLRIWPYVLDLGCSRSTRLERDLANFLWLVSTLLLRSIFLSQNFPPNLQNNNVA